MSGQPYHHRAILPNGEIDERRDESIIRDALLRKRERNKLAARKKRDRKKQRLEALEARERDLRKQHLALSMELMVYRTANQNQGLCVQSQMASDLGFEITAEATEIFNDISSRAMQPSSSPSPEPGQQERTVDTPDYSAINGQLSDIYDSAVLACRQAQASHEAANLLYQDIRHLANLLHVDSNCRLL